MRPDARTTDSRTFALVVVSATLAIACLSDLEGSPATKPKEVEALKQQVVALQRRATVAELESNRLKREITRLKAELEEARQAAESCPEVEELEAVPTSPAMIGLDQIIEETDLEEAPIVAPQPVSAEAGDSERSAGNPVEGLEVVEDPEAGDSEVPPISATPATPAAMSTTAQALYDEGYALFHQQRYADAEERFSRFVELHPQTDLTDNALFWIGECRYARGELSSALEAFSGTVERFPHSNKVGDALLKAGKCLESLGDTQQARQTYEEVVGRFPSSAAAAQARDRLKALR